MLKKKERKKEHIMVSNLSVCLSLLSVAPRVLSSHIHGTHTHARARAHAHTHIRTHARTHAHSHARKYARTHASSRTHADPPPSHTHTHTHTYTQCAVHSQQKCGTGGVENAEHRSTLRQVSEWITCKFTCLL